MAKLTFNKNATGKFVTVFFRNTSVTSSVSGLTGLTSGSLNCVYWRSGAVAAALTLTSLASVTSTHLTGGFIEVSATGMPGIYRLDLANTMLATGADFVTVVLKGAANGDEVPMEIELLDAVNVSGGVVEANIVQVSGTVIPAPATAGYLPVTLKVGTGTGELSITSGRVAADVLYISGAAVSASLSQIGINVVSWSGTNVTALSSGRVVVSVGEYQSGLTPLQPTVAGRTLDVTATGEAGIDWGNIGNAGTVVNLSQTSISSVSTGAAGPTSGQIATQVWATVVSNNTAAGSFGLRLSRFPDVDAGSNGGLPLVDASGAVKLSNGTGANQILLSSGQVTATGGGVAPTSGEVATQVWATVIEGSFTAMASMKLQNAVAAAKVSGQENLSPVFRDLSDTLNRITATTTLSGNRTAITYNMA